MSEVQETVSVIIPTKGERNSSLITAIKSVDNQVVDLDIEIIIADDSVSGLDESAVRAAAGNRELRIVETSKEKGLARQFGVAATRGRWVAFLDDDDEWDSDKVRMQLQLARKIQSEGRQPIVSCRFRHLFLDDGRVVGGLPARLISSESVAEYLFVRRPARVGRPSIYTSTIFTTSDVARAVPWRNVPRHQDWDWLVRAQELDGVQIAHCSAELVTIVVGSNGSISAANDWRSSADWASQALKIQDNSQVYVDFLAAQPLRYAIQARNYFGIKAVITEIYLARKLPSVRSAVTGLAGITSRKLMVRIMSLSNPCRNK